MNAREEYHGDRRRTGHHVDIQAGLGAGFQVIEMHPPTSAEQPTHRKCRYARLTRFVEHCAYFATVERCIEGILEKVYEPAPTLIDRVAGS
jgi:predicted nuclease with RNAse H fold